MFAYAKRFIAKTAAMLKTATWKIVRNVLLTSGDCRFAPICFIKIL